MPLKEQTISGAKWMTVSKIANSLIQILKLVILARLLSKSDFGIIAIVLMVLGFTEIFADLGFAVGLVHKQDITKKQYSSVFWTNLLLSVALYAIIALSAPLFATYYAQKELATLIPIMGLQLIINAFGRMFFTFKTKNLEFKFIAIVDMLGLSIGTVITIILAVNGLGVYSLVYGYLAQALVTQGIYFVSGTIKYPVLFHLNIKEISDLLKIGGYQVGAQVLDYISNKIDIFLIGRFFGMELLGLYNLAKELVMKPIQIINSIITSVATPAFAKFQDNIKMIQEKYLDVLKLLSILNFPIFIIFFIFADPMVFILYGSEKAGVAIFLKILSFWGMFNSVGNPAGILMVAKGRTDLGFYWTLVRIAVMTATILIAGQFSIYAVAFSQTAIAFVFLFLYWRMMVYNIAAIPLKDYLKSCGLATVVSLVAGVPTWFIATLSDNLYFQGCVLCLFGLLVVLLYCLIDRNYVLKIKEMLLSR